MKIEKITYNSPGTLNLEELLGLYNNAGWSSYTCDPPRLKQAFNNSLFIMEARFNGNLVGIVRIIGDGKTIIYIQDIIVHSKFKRMGIGTQLMAHVLKKFEDVRQKVLLTDDTPATRGFYEALGFASADDGRLIAFTKMT